MGGHPSSGRRGRGAPKGFRKDSPRSAGHAGSRFRRLVTRYERYAENFLGMIHLACCHILLRNLL